MRKLLAVLAVVPVLLTSASLNAGSSKMQSDSAYDYTFEAIDEKPLPFSDFRGKVVLVVNTASFCGFTKQYAGLEAIYEKYKDRGFVVLGVPSNDFGEQEPGTNAEIATFCQGAFNVTFPLTTKYSVNGAGAHPFYKWAKSVLGDNAAPTWNFHKYLVGADGKLVASFTTTIEPDAPQVVKAIETALAAVGKGS